ncbi:hypothetical protein HYX58_02155 [Candidatus Dependentiae bacterium]|nr:hypothetical protein [Candidatus Dependentiae bacterium]
MKNSFLFSLAFLLSLGASFFSQASISSLDELKPIIQKDIWINSSFSKEEIQLLANVIFFSIYRAETQQAYRTYATILTTFAILAEKQARAGFNVDNVGIESLKIAIDNLKMLQPISKTVIDVHARLVDNLMRHSNKRLAAIFVSCAEHATSVVTTAANKKREKIIELLSKAQSRYADESQKLHELADSFKLLKTNMETNQNSHNAYAIEKVQRDLFSELDECLHQLHSGKNQFDALAFEIEVEAIDLFKLYYSAICDEMIKREYKSDYFALLASPEECNVIQLSTLPESMFLKN